MNREYKNFHGDLSSDLDLEHVTEDRWDFVNQVSNDENTDGTTTFTENFMEELAQYGGGDENQDNVVTPYTQGSDLYENRDVESDFSSEGIKAKLNKRRNQNKGKGLSSFTKGLTQGLGLSAPPKVEADNTATYDNQGKNTGYNTENRNPVIPILIGLIGVAVLFFAISKSKIGKESPMPTPRPIPSV